MATVYHTHMTQRVASDPHWKVNCTAYCAAMMFNDATLGGCTVTGRQVRAMSNEPNPDPNSPGLNITQIRNVGHELRIDVIDRQGDYWKDIMAALNEGRRVLLQVEYKSMGTRRCQTTGDFGHAILLVKQAANMPNGDDAVVGSDPLCTMTRKYPASLLREAAQDFARRTGQSEGLRWASTRPIPKLA